MSRDGSAREVQALPVNVPEPAVWVDKAPRFWYRESVRAAQSSCSSTRRPWRSGRPSIISGSPTCLNTAIKPPKPYTAVTLPFTTFSLDEGQGIQFNLDAAVAMPAGRLQLRGRSTPGGRQGRPRGRRPGGPVRAEFDINGAEPRKSPDGKLEAIVSQLQRRASARPGQKRGDSPDHRRFRGRLLRSGFARLVSRLEAGWRSTRSSPGSGATCITSSPHRRTSFSRNTARSSTRSPATCSTSNGR